MMLRIINTFQKNNFRPPRKILHETCGSHLGFLGFSCTVLISMKVYKCILKTLFASEKYF
jgi:hypothetical protein